MDTIAIDEEFIQAIATTSGRPGGFSFTPGGLPPGITLVPTSTVSVSIPSVITTITVTSMRHRKKNPET
ncbi:hypothetical protein G7Y79_00002g005060 [Physcia stellaris]|nr:hypothetical protein G7Y79_00002g005060 [Physcia stellaris]